MNLWDWVILAAVAAAVIFAAYKVRAKRFEGGGACAGCGMECRNCEKQEMEIYQKRKKKSRTAQLENDKCNYK